LREKNRGTSSHDKNPLGTNEKKQKSTFQSRNGLEYTAAPDVKHGGRSKIFPEEQSDSSNGAASNLS
jgi:hypothetical protein